MNPYSMLGDWGSSERHFCLATPLISMVRGNSQFYNEPYLVGVLTLRPLSPVHNEILVESI